MPLAAATNAAIKETDDRIYGIYRMSSILVGKCAAFVSIKSAQWPQLQDVERSRKKPTIKSRSSRAAASIAKEARFRAELGNRVETPPPTAYGHPAAATDEDGARLCRLQPATHRCRNRSLHLER